MILAYLDPGSGSQLLQLLLAGVLGVAFTVKTFWHNILAFFSRSRTREKPDEHDAP